MGVLGESWPDDPRAGPFLRRLATGHDEPAMRWSALWALGQRWRREDPDTSRLLRDRVTNDRARIVRTAAARAFARSWPP
jgi:hypothetical protein